MNAIRGLVYRLGFRPRPGSIFYSPSRDLLLKAGAAIKQWGHKW